VPAEKCIKCRRVIAQNGNPRSYTKNWLRTWWNEEKTICYNCGKEWFE